MDFLRFLFRRHPWPTALIVVGLATLVWFGSHFVSDVLYFSNPAHREQPLAGWMSPRYVAKSWGLPPEVVAEVMQLSPDHRRITLDDVTTRTGVSLEELQRKVTAAKAELEARRRAGKPDSPPPPEVPHD